MPRALLTLSLLLFSSLAFAQDVRSPAVIEAEIDGHIRSMRESLADIAALSEAAHTRAVQQQIRRKTQRIEEHILRVDLLADELARTVTLPPPDVILLPPPVVIEEIPPPPPMGPIPCSPGDFQRVLAAVDGETFSDAKQQRLRDAGRDRWFTVNQVKRLVDTFDFSDGKIEAAAWLYPHVVDTQNWYQVYDAFTFDSDKDKLRKRIGN